MNLMNLIHITSTSLRSSNRPVLQRFGWVILTLGLLVVYVLLNFVLPGVRMGNLNLFIFQPLLWLSIAILAIWLCTSEGNLIRPLESRNLIGIAAMIGGIQIAVSILVGFLSGFGKSPYSHTFSMILLNLWFLATRLAGVESARWYLSKSLGRINTGLGYLTAWLVPLILLIPTGKFELLGQPENAFRFVGGSLIPAAAENLLATYLVISTGPLGSIAYLGVMQAFEWLSPILPDLPWLAVAFVGVLVPLLGLVVLNREDTSPLSDATQQTSTRNQEKHASPGSWLLVAALAAGVIWFNSGALGVRPSLISGNSMNPMLYPGDVVITKTIAPESIHEGDVIRFHRDGIDIVHRVRQVQNQESALVFITRGDNNNVDDEPVTSGQIEGKVILKIPKIGWIGIWFRQALTRIGGAS